MTLIAVLALAGADTARAADWQAADWLTLGGETRARVETVDNQYRAGRSGGDQLLAIRTLLSAEADFGVVGAKVEIQDSRTYLDDTGTPLSTSFVNTAELLQANLRWKVGRHEMRAGRLTLDIGSRRFVERNDFRNTINGFDGVHWQWRVDDARVHGFFTNPVRKRPGDRASLADNEAALDERERSRRFWGLHVIGPPSASNVRGEVFVYGLEEDDSANTETADRSVVAPGFRLQRAPAAGHWDGELETAYRFGRRTATADPGDQRRLDVRAWMLHTEVGYTFDSPWHPRLALEYDFASGDDDPTDGTYGRYERFYGTRRGDLGNTSLHGPLTRSNVSVPGIRLSFARGRLDGRVHVQWASLDAARDAWIQAGLQDETGRSGRFLGHTLDGRVRYWLRPGRARVEVGGSVLWFGEFAESVPGGPDGDRTVYGYVQATLTL